MAMSNLSMVLSMQRKHEEAARLSRKALEVILKVHRGPHPDVATTLYTLAGVLWDKGEPAQAEELYRDALEMRRKWFGYDDQGVQANLHGIAIILEARGDLVGAGRIYLDIGRLDIAVTLLRGYLKQCEEAVPLDACALAGARVLLGACLLGQGELGAALDLLLEGYEGLPDGTQETLELRFEAAEWITQVLDALEAPSEADKWRSIVEDLKEERTR